LTGEAVFVASELLSVDQIALLRRALGEWGGPAHCSDEMAVGMGFAGAQDLYDRCDGLRAALRDDIPLTTCKPFPASAVFNESWPKRFSLTTEGGREA
jgi:hypothetical protein